MLDLFLKLIDRCIDLLKRQQEIDRAFFTDFVGPIMVDFEVTHKDYVASFRRYRKLIQDTNELLTPSHPVLDAIREDILYTADLRSKLWELQTHKDDRRLGHLIQVIIRYLEFAASLDPTKGLELGRSHILINYDMRLDIAASSQMYLDKGPLVINPKPYANLARRWLLNGLVEIFDQTKNDMEKKQAAIVTLDEMIGLIQENYAHVIHEHAKLREVLLKAK